MKKSELNLIEDPVDLEILSNVDDKKNITAISIATGYTYKSVFHRIKRLEKQGLVKLEKTKDITEGAVLTIPKDIQEKIGHEIRRYRFAKQELQSLLKDPHSKKDINELLKFIEENRLVSSHDIDSFIWTKYEMDPKGRVLHDAYNCLKDIGHIRSRNEITRSGKKFLEENSSK